MKDHFTDKDPGDLRERVFVVIGVVFFAFFILVARLWYLQIMKGEYFSELSQNNRIRLTRTPAPRGLIMDRNGIRLAENRPGFDLLVIPEDVDDWDKTKRILIEAVDIDEKTIEKRLKKAKGRAPFRAIKLKEDLTWEEMARVAAYKFELPGVVIEVGPKRTYPYKSVTAHLLGYLGEISEKQYARYRKRENNPYRRGDKIGKSGIEATFEDVLRGTDGGRQVEVDATGRIIKVIKNIPPYPGNNVRLTIDLPTQLAAWEAMEGRAGAVVAMDPRNGKILAMVSSPSFDPNDLTDGISREEWRAIISNPFKVLTNRTIQGQYPPASTFKVITAAAALEEGIIEPATRLLSGPSFWYGGREYRDWKEEGHGKVGVYTAIVESADTFFYQLGLRVGLERLAHYAREFGLGEPTGIGVGNEQTGLVPSNEWKMKVHGTPWYDGETISVAVGQGFMLTTPLQILNAYAAIANGGRLFVPQLMESIEDPEGRVLQKFSPKEKGRVRVSAETLAILKRALRGVVEEENGTAKGLNVGGLRIAGKTGTAQVVRMKERIRDIEKIPYRLRDHAWFVGFAPYDDPRIVVAVIVEHGGFGARAAAPVALKVISAYLKGGVPGTGTEPAYRTRDVNTAADEVLAKEKEAWKSL